MQTKKERKRNKRTLRRGGTKKEVCCMCGKKIKSNQSFIPSECLLKYGKNRAHKICSDCWWGEFASETASHKCPGCIKGIPIKSDPNKGKVIDLTKST
jgi:hypothetical protein